MIPLLNEYYLFDLVLIVKRSPKFLGMPCINNRTRGNVQFALLSTKSKICAPLTGRIKAAEKAQIVAQIKITLKGNTKTVIATTISSAPINTMSDDADLTENPTVVKNGIHSGLTPKAKIP